MSIGIYKITNLLNQKCYIGQSIHIERRWQEHCHKSTKSMIGKAIQKYGKENFSFQILEECDQSLLDIREAYYIKYFNSLVPNGYNVALIGTNGKNQYFLSYDKTLFENLIKDIKFSALSFPEIANQYDLHLSTIYYINRGSYHTLENEKYPLRKVKDFSKKHYYCIDCGIEISKGAIRCVKCDHQKQQKCLRPSREELKNLIRTTSFVQIGKTFGVSDNAIKKWCKNYNLPSKKKDIITYSDKEWTKI